MKIYADFQNADPLGRLRLTCNGTIDDLKQHNVLLQEGVSLTFGDEELEAIGMVTYSQEEKIWVAVIDWNKIVRL